MKKPDWDRIQEIFCSALERPRAERKRFVEEACAGNSYHLREVIALLEAHESAGGILESPVFPVGREPEDPAEKIGGRYIIERRLGHGGMGEVYLARDTKINDRSVVIKVLSSALRENTYARQKFKQESEALSRIHHDGVVSVLDTGEWADGRPYFVMPYLQGETLRPQIPPHGMDLERAAAILKQIGAALEHVHEKEIFHRDLKPENIMLKRDSDRVVLIDFGIAKVRHSSIAPTTANGPSAGTLAYMSPEHLQGEDITAASDVYAMAVVAYQMVTGRQLFAPESAAQLLDLQREGVRAQPIDLRRGVSRKAQAILIRALSFDPNSRYQNARQFGDELADALLKPETVPVTRRRQPWSRRKQIAAIAGAIVFVSLVSFGVYRWLNPPPPPPTKGFDYWLEVQRLVDGKDYGEPRKSNGDETFHTGDKFQLNVRSLDDPGFFYAFNEGASGSGNLSFRLVYPRKDTSNGSASLGANQTVQIEWINFRGPAGAENLWLIWSVSPVNELEAVKTQALAHPEAGLTEENVKTVKAYLKTLKDTIKVRDASYEESQEAKVRARSDLVLTLLQLKHR